MKINEGSPFTTKGKVARPRGRQPLLTELGHHEQFLGSLERADKYAFNKIVKKLFDLSQHENPVVALRACEIALAYCIGRPDVIQHNQQNNIQITFVRAEPINSNTRNNTKELTE